MELPWQASVGRLDFHQSKGRTIVGVAYDHVVERYILEECSLFPIRCEVNALGCWIEHREVACSHLQWLSGDQLALCGHSVKVINLLQFKQEEAGKADAPLQLVFPGPRQWFKPPHNLKGGLFLCLEEDSRLIRFNQVTLEEYCSQQL